MFQEINDDEIERLLNESDFDLSGDDDDDEYLPPEIQQTPQQLEESEEEVEEFWLFWLHGMAWSWTSKFMLVKILYLKNSCKLLDWVLV